MDSEKKRVVFVRPKIIQINVSYGKVEVLQLTIVVALDQRGKSKRKKEKLTYWQLVTFFKLISILRLVDKYFTITSITSDYVKYYFRVKLNYTQRINISTWLSL